MSTGEADSCRLEFDVDAGSNVLPLLGGSPSGLVLSPLKRHMKYGMLEPDFSPEFPSPDAEFVPISNIASPEL